MTLISIVTPSLNQGRFLGEALESVRLQNHSCIEHLVLDGGSTDETLGLLQSLDGLRDWSHLRWLSGPDGGQSEALNRGFAQAKGDIIGWLNSDDRYRPVCFNHVVRAFEENPGVDIFYGDYTSIDEDGKLLETRREIEFNRFVLLHHRVLYIATTATFFRRRIFEEGNWLKEDLHYAMDYEFFLRLVEKGYCIRRIPQVIADFRLHPESKSCSMRRFQLREKSGIMRTFSAITRKCRSPLLRSVVFLALQVAAALMRWFEKLLRGHYLVQYLNSPREES
jgi:glycosyltransferase involved in cell wall biosynthesis